MRGTGSAGGGGGGGAACMHSVPKAAALCKLQATSCLTALQPSDCQMCMCENFNSRNEILHVTGFWAAVHMMQLLLSTAALK